MIISNKSIQRISQVYNEQSRVGRSQRTNSDKAMNDKVTLSSEGKELQAVLQHVRSAEEIRPHAEQVKQAVKSGTYNVTGEQIADSMLKSWK